MVAPLLIAGGALAAGGLAGSIFGKKSIPSYDISGITNAINQGANQERGYLGQITPGVQANQAAFKTGITGAEDTATAAQKAAGQSYLSQLDPITSRILANQTNTLKQNIFGQIPEATQAAREALAASGGLSRGVSAESLARIPIQAAQQFGQGATALNTQSLQAKQQAVGQLFSEESAQIAEKLGIDRDTYNTILNSGDQALMAQLSGLIDTTRNQTNQLVGAETFKQTGNFASGAQDAANQNAIWQSLSGLGGNLLGAGLTNVAPAARKKAVTSAVAGEAA